MAMMTRFWRKWSLGLLLTASLVGCQGATHLGGAPSSDGQSAGTRVDSVQDFQSTQDPTVDAPGGSVVESAQTNAASKPHAGGVSAPPAEMGDDGNLTVEGDVEPECRTQSKKIRFRVKGSLVCHENNGDVKPCRRASIEGQDQKRKIWLRFWNGESCGLQGMTVEEDGFEGYLTADEISDLTIFGQLKIDSSKVKSLHPTEEDEVEKSSIAISDSIKKAIAKKIKVVVDVQDVETPSCSDSLGDQGSIMTNHLVLHPPSEKLPACSMGKIPLE